MVGMLSDVGLKRKLNEDSVGYYESDVFKIYVVADGMGGHNAGEVASKMAVDEIINYTKTNCKRDNIEELLANSIICANKSIYEFSKTRNSLNGMGTTVTACLMSENFIQIANVGDSSCFGIDKNERFIKKLTKDHSLVQELVDIGSISEFEAINHPKKNIITRALGTDVEVDIDIFPIHKDIFNIFLLCTDGLTNEISKEELLNTVIEKYDYNEIVECLIDKAKINGGRDNITVLLFGGEM